MRSQPDVVKSPVECKMTHNEFEKFGVLYQSSTPFSYWKFEFEVQHPSVFENGVVPLGALYRDCEGVPMVQCEDQLEKMPLFLDTTDNLRNIYFEVI